MAVSILSAVAIALFTSTVNALTSRQGCSENYKICDPIGANTGTLGPLNAGWGKLYQNIINVVDDYTIDDAPTATLSVNPDGPAKREMAFCCSNFANCLLVKDYDIPMCWDRFTTNVFFPDGTYGSVVSGDFNTSDGSSVNLVYGDYTMKDGTTGNIYSGNAISSMKPDPSTMTRPRPWTNSGVGSAIPATELGTTGILSTGVTVIPATTIAASTAGSITMIATMTGCGNCPPYETTVPGPVQLASTQLASTSVFTTGILAPSELAGEASTSFSRGLTSQFLVICFMVAFYHL